jgi:hypothetical protein
MYIQEFCAHNLIDRPVTPQIADRKFLGTALVSLRGMQSRQASAEIGRQRFLVYCSGE